MNIDLKDLHNLKVFYKKNSFHFPFLYISNLYSSYYFQYLKFFKLNFHFIHAKFYFPFKFIIILINHHLINYTYFNFLALCFFTQPIINLYQFKLFFSANLLNLFISNYFFISTYIYLYINQHHFLTNYSNLKPFKFFIQVPKYINHNIAVLNSIRLFYLK